MTREGKAGKAGYSFKWSDEEWAILEPLTQEQRMHLLMSVTFSGLGLLGYVKKNGVPSHADADKSFAVFGGR